MCQPPLGRSYGLGCRNHRNHKALLKSLPTYIEWANGAVCGGEMQLLKRAVVVQVSWLQKSRRLSMGVAARAAMGSLVSDEDIDELLIMFQDVSVSGALVRSRVPLYLQLLSRSARE